MERRKGEKRVGPGGPGHKRILMSKRGNGEKREARTQGKERDGERRRSMVGLVPAAEARGPRFVSRSVVLSVVFSAAQRISLAAVEDVTARGTLVVVRTRDRHKYDKSLVEPDAMALKILLACLLIAMASSVPSSPEDHHRLPSHRVVWPAWYRDRLLHARHDEHRATRETTTTRGPWSPLQVSATRSPQQINSVSRHHRAEHKFGVVTIAEQDGTRATAYAGYRDDHRHQPREAVTQTYQLAPTAAPTYTRYHAGRRVCTRQAPVTSHHRGKQIRLVYTEMTSNFFCCPGWSQVTHLSFGCNKPTCPALCLNGGICTSGKCTCPKGYTGNQCQTDVDECTIEKPCGQLCINTPGSYRCYCRAGFKLQQDGQSCRRNDTDENAFEARDLENDFHDMSTTKDPISSHDTENEVNNDDQDYEIILKRLTKLEKQVAKNRKKDTEASEMNTKVTLAIENINEMKRTVENVQLMQQEVYDMRNKMKQYEVEMRKIHHLMNRIAELETHLRIRCRSAIPINSGLLNF